MRRLAGAALIAVLLASCAGDDTRVTGDIRTVGTVMLTFTARPATIELGQTVRLALNVQNSSGREQPLRFPSGRRYDFVARSSNREVWRWSSGRDFARAQETETLEGLSAFRYAEPWTPPADGRYRVAGAFAADGFSRELSGWVVVAG